MRALASKTRTVFYKQVQVLQRSVIIKHLNFPAIDIMMKFNDAEHYKQFEFNSRITSVFTIGPFGPCPPPLAPAAEKSATKQRP